MKRFFVLFTLIFLAQSAHAETIETRNLMAGTRYQTPVIIKTGEKAGPTIVVLSGVHGDETAGYLAARELQNWPVEAGKLVLIPDAHVLAIQANKRFVERNMNALFPGKPNGDAMERLAFEIWDVIKKSKPDLLLTLHESRGFYIEDRKRYGQTFTYDFAHLKPRFERVRQKLNAQIPVAKQRFHHKIEPFKTCPTYCAFKYLRVPATSIETARPLPLSKRRELQLMACQAFFDEWGLEISAVVMK